MTLNQTATANQHLSADQSALSQRPADLASSPTVRALDATLPGNGSDEATVALKPGLFAPRRKSSRASEGEAKFASEPNVRTPRQLSRLGGSGQAVVHVNSSRAAPDRNNPQEKAGDEAMLPLATSTNTPRRKSPAKAGRDEARSIPEPENLASRHEIISDGQSIAETPPESAVAGDQGALMESASRPNPSPLIAEITQLVRMRRRWHKAEKSLTLQGKALCRSWSAGDKDEANRLYDAAAEGSASDPTLLMALAPFLTAKARFEEEREGIEKTLRKLAKSLPVWKAWAEGVKGLGELRLSILVGECGDIGSYRNPSCLWKRMGLAVMDGQRQRRVSNADEALAHGYNPERRAIAYVMATELLKAQVRNVKDDAGKRTDASTAIGPYGQLYLDRKAYEAGREGITKSHANNRAARYMAKRVLRDLFAAWRAA